jgi:hypothetical protein
MGTVRNTRAVKIGGEYRDTPCEVDLISGTHERKSRRRHLPLE